MGGRGANSSGGAGGGMGGAGVGMNVLNNTILQPTVQAAQNANNATFAATDQSGYHDLYNGRKYFQDQNLTIDQQLAVINYLSNTTENGSLYSMSQNLNYAMATGKKLTANQQFVHDQLMDSMHNLGYNLNLTRYDHPAMLNTLLSNAGLSGSYDSYTVPQLKQALVGTKFGENKFISTSYNDFKNAPNATTFTSRAVKITYKAKASTQAMMPGNGPGGALGEIVLAPSKGANMKIVDIRSTGKKARRQGTQSYTMPQVELVVEVG